MRGRDRQEKRAVRSQSVIKARLRKKRRENERQLALATEAAQLGISVDALLYRKFMEVEELRQAR
ncbi:MAG TPA: hypothetical protein P5267_03105 [Patescibacteria group bacterium]|nr:hypothetical protein [Patescibacteria group bacterium]